MLIPNRTLGDVLANLGALALGVAPCVVYFVFIVVLVSIGAFIIARLFQ